MIHSRAILFTMKNIVLIIFLALFASSCQEEKEQPAEKPIVKNPIKQAEAYDRGIQADWIKNASIYEVNIRQFTAEGTLNAFEKQLPRLREMGVDILLFMPIQPIGKKNRVGDLGNPYSISNYDVVHPDYGTVEDFTRVVKKAHDLGMYVLLDWVADATAFDHVWLKNRPDFYSGFYDGKSPLPAMDTEGKSTGQTDLADLDYSERDLEGAMIESMRGWVLYSDIDGYRCVDADLVPLDFWKLAKQRISESKDSLFFITASRDPQYLQVFDAGYGDNLYASMRQVANQENTPAVFGNNLAIINGSFPPDAMHVFYTSTNSINSTDGSALENFGEANKVFFLLAATFKGGIPLLMGGQEASLSRKLAPYKKDPIDWSGEDLSAFYKNVFALKHANPALWNGNHGGNQIHLETGVDDKVYAFLRERDGNRALVFLNFSRDSVTCKPDLTGRSGTYRVFETKETVAIGDRPEIKIEPFGYLILTI